MEQSETTAQPQSADNETSPVPQKDPIFGFVVTPFDEDAPQKDDSHVDQPQRRLFLKRAAAAVVGAASVSTKADKIAEFFTQPALPPKQPLVASAADFEPSPTHTPTPTSPSQIAKRQHEQSPITPAAAVPEPTKTPEPAATPEKEKKIDITLLTGGKQFEITQEFGRTPFYLANRHLYSGSQHNGLDVGVPSGTALTAPIEGEVITAELHQGQGNRVIVKTKWGYLLLAHLRKIEVKIGQTIKQGALLGLSGGGISDPGRGVSTGAHLHFEVWDENNQPFDPMELFEVTKRR